MGDVMSCGGANITKKDHLIEIYEWFQTLDQQTDEKEIKIPRQKFEQYFERVKEMVGIQEDRYGQNFSEPRCQIIDNNSTPAISKFVKRLQIELSKRNRIDTAVVETLEDALPKTVLIYVCQGGSLNSLVEKRFRDVPHDLFDRIILVIVHVTREDKLPNLPSSVDIASNSSFKNIGRVVDMGFSDDIIYKCEKNTRAITEIMNFCKEFKKSRQFKDTSVVVSEQRTKSDQEKTTDVQNNELDLGGLVPITVYLMTPNQTNAQAKFLKAFQTKLRELGIECEPKEPSEARDLDPDMTLFIVCNAKSRTESDINSCYDANLRAVKNRTILIMLHIVREGKEQKMSTESTFTNEDIVENSSLSKIIDIAFDNDLDNGIFKCKMNENAIDYFRKLYGSVTSNEKLCE